MTASRRPTSAELLAEGLKRQPQPEPAKPQPRGQAKPRSSAASLVEGMRRRSRGSSQ